MSIYEGKQYHSDQVHYLRADISYTDDGSTVSMGWLPKGAVVIDGGVVVSTVFDGDTTNTVDLGFRNAGDGTADDADEFASALSLAAAGRIVADDMATAGDLLFPSGAEVTATVVSTAGATAGSGVVYISYLVNNED